MLIVAALLPTLSVGKPAEFVSGDLRVQFLSDSLVRLELKGPSGFEDRPTFTVVNRSLKGGSFIERREGSATILRSRGYSIRIPDDRKGLDGVTLVDRKGKLVYKAGVLPEPTWLPSPSKMPSVYPLADHPRMVPPAGGPIPKNLNGQFASTSGYDTTNDSPDLYLFIPKDYKQFRSDFLKLTGPVPLVPRYLMGFIDSRWYPYTEKQALDAIDEYRKRQVPLDVFVCDTDWRVGASKGYGVNKTYFPDMPSFLSKAHDKGVRVMFNDHPEPQAPTALDPKETQYRWDGLTSVLGMGMDLWWFDRNWSTVLNEPMPGIRKETWGASLFHDVTQEFRPNLRPAIMSNVDGIDNGFRNRAPLAAFHRYPIWWTGDTGSEWRFLQFAVENAVDEGVLGMLPYVHEDLGGHTGTPDSELYARYLQYGALSPITRVHCTFKLNRYPWMYGPVAEKIAIDALKFRYRLLPTLYEAAKTASEDGTPILRRLDLDYPGYTESADNHQYLLGNDILVVPVIKPLATEGNKIPSNLLHTPTGDPGLAAEIYPNWNLSGTPAVTRTDANVDFDWGQGSPATGIGIDNFSIKWKGTIGPVPKTGHYRFSVTSDDGSRLTVNGKTIINEWHNQSELKNTGVIDLVAGQTVPVELDYMELGGDAVCRLTWAVNEANPIRSTVTAWIPPGQWRDLYDGTVFTGPKKVNVGASLSKIPMFVKDGSLIVTGDDVARAEDQIGKGVTLDVFPGAPGEKVVRRFYEDDGVSNDYLKGAGISRQLVCETKFDGTVQIRIEKEKGTFAGAVAKRDFTVRVHVPSANGLAVTVNGGQVTPKVERDSGTAATILDTLKARGGDVVEVKVSQLAKTNSADVRVRAK